MFLIIYDTWLFQFFASQGVVPFYKSFRAFHSNRHETGVGGVVQFFLTIIKCWILNQVWKPINSKFRVPRKQGEHFLGARAENQDSWVFYFPYIYEIYKGKYWFTDKKS
jgi:hypothetical protein